MYFLRRNRLVLQGFNLRVVWESPCRAAPTDLCKSWHLKKIRLWNLLWHPVIRVPRMPKTRYIFFQRVARTTTHFSRLYYDGRTSPERSTKMLRVGVDLETSTYEDLENLDLNSALSLMLRCHQSDCQKLNFVYFEELRTFNTLETLGYRFKMILLDQEMDFKKNPIEILYFFLIEKYFQKKVGYFFRKIFDFFLDFPNCRKKSTFSKKWFFENVFFFENRFFSDFPFFWKYFSIRKNYLFSMGFFLKFI